MTTDTHADWIDSPYADDLDIGWVGPHDLDVEWEGHDDRPARSEADVTTDTLSDLFDEIDSAGSGDIVWLDVDEYQVDGESSRQDIPSGVTVASDGALIYSDDEHDGVFELTNDDARLTGFQFEGSQETGDHETQSVGVFLKADVQLDNCVFSQWMSMGVYCSANGSGPVEPHVHHCIFEDCRTDGMGYGIAAYSGSDPLIEYSFVNNNRHGIASNGAENQSYRAENNLHGPDGMLFQFECHAPGGDRMDVLNNEFRMVIDSENDHARAYAQRGTPEDVATIDNNWIYNDNEPGSQPDSDSDDAIIQYNHDSSDWENVEFSGNHYGDDEPSDSSIGIQPLSEVNGDTGEGYEVTFEVEDSDTLEGVDGAQIAITRTEDHTSEYDYEVSASEGADAVTDQLEAADDGETVYVSGEGNYDWERTVVVPNNRTVEFSEDLEFTIPQNHDLWGVSIGSRTVYTVITNGERSGAEGITIRGGSWDMSATPESNVGYAGAWLHDATDSSIEDVRIDGAGDAIYGSGSYRGFGIALTDCTDCQIIDSEAYDSGYDDIAVRGGCTDCDVIRSGGSGGSSGTIQTARWGNWGLTDRPTGTTFEACWGRRIYCHSGIDTVWDGCESDYRLQTIGVGSSATFRNSEDFEGKVLVYTLDDPQPYTLIENFDFDSSGRNMAIQIGPNSGQAITDVEITDSYADRQTFIHFNDYSTNVGIDTVEVTDCELHGSELISRDGGVDVDTLIFRDCEIHDFSTGIVGSYDEVIVEDCDVYGMSENDLVGSVSGSVTTSGNSYD